jgi:hypothetical protein
MQGFSEVNAASYYPTEIARDISKAYYGMGAGQAGLENRAAMEAFLAEEERRRVEAEKKARKNSLLGMGALIGATALTGGVAALAAPGAAAGSFGAGLSTFGKGALGAFTGAGSVAPGVKGLAGGLSTAAGALGRGVTGSLINNAVMGAMGGGGGGGGGISGGSAGMGGGGINAGQVALGALGSYLQDSQAANRSNRIMEGTLKDPAVRAALYPGVDQSQIDALLKYKQDNFGTIEGAQFLQQALPMLSRSSAGNVDFDRQMQLQNARIAHQTAMDIRKFGVSSLLENKEIPFQLPKTTLRKPFDPKAMGFESDMNTGFEAEN